MDALREMLRGFVLAADAFGSPRGYHILVENGLRHDAEQLAKNLKNVGDDMRIALTKREYGQQTNSDSRPVAGR